MNARWKARAARARLLAATQSSVGDLLNFYAQVLEFQCEACVTGAADMGAFLALLEREGPEELRAFAVLARGRAPEDLLAAGTEAGGCFVAMVFEQVLRHAEPCTDHAGGISLLREAGDGLQRSLMCAVCGHEWTIGRIECPACSERRFESLPVYAAEAFDHLRVEACDTCRSYVLSVNMARCPEAEPWVDDLAALPVHLWAQGQGYSRKVAGLFGY